MVILALDTTTRAGSVAVWRAGTLLGVRIGDPQLTHGERLPFDIADLLEAHGLSVGDVDAYAVAAGPGSFTGLRVGIATIQGLALAQQKLVAPVSALAALTHATRSHADAAAPIAVWMDALRQEVFAALYAPSTRPGVLPSELAERGTVMVPPGYDMRESHTVGRPEDVIDRWRPNGLLPKAVLTGDGAVRYADLLIHALGGALQLIPPPDALAPAVAELAAMAGEDALVRPHAVQPVYVRRPDAELARERRRARESTGRPDRA